MLSIHCDELLTRAESLACKAVCLLLENLNPSKRLTLLYLRALRYYLFYVNLDTAQYIIL